MLLESMRNPKKILGFSDRINSMKFTDYISSHQVFTSSDLMAAMDSPSAAEEQLRLAVRAGTVERVRRGLLVSNYGRHEDSAVEPSKLVSTLDDEAVVSLHSALELHGVAHNVSFVFQFRSDTVRQGFAFREVSYEVIGPVDGTRWRLIGSGGTRSRVTTKEQAIVDCLDRPSKAGGAEEVVRSLTAFAYVDLDELAELAGSTSPATVSRVGWLLSEKREDWMVPDSMLERMDSLLGSGPYRLGRPRPGESGWSKRWRLVLPASAEEVATWITRS